LPQNLDAAIKQLNDQALDIAVHWLGPNGAFGWVARLGEDHGGMEYRWSFGIVGDAVTPLNGTL
jgi:hypothetical protein